MCENDRNIEKHRDDFLVVRGGVDGKEIIIRKSAIQSVYWSGGKLFIDMGGYEEDRFWVEESFDEIKAMLLGKN